MPVRHITPAALKQHLALEGTRAELLDVREPWEFRLAHIEGSRLIPMRQIPWSLERLRREQEIIVICHHGVRSLQVARFLDHNGFTNVVNLTGGIDAWSLEADPSVPRY